MYQTTKAATEEYLFKTLEKRTMAAGHLGQQYTHMWESLGELVNAGGKRLRPYLTMAGYGKFAKEIVPVAAAWELLHIAMLVHDDIIDQDTVRHGKDNIVVMYLKRYSNLPKDERQHYSESAAVLAGDALMSEAFASIHEANIPYKLKSEVTGLLHRSTFEVIGGELLDVEAPLLPNETIDPLIIYRYKTASYSFIGPLLSGAVCSKSSAKTKELLFQYGENLGIGFQLQDDLLGVFGDESITGKSSLTDLKEAKLTYLIAEHKLRCNQTQLEKFDEIFGNRKATKSQLESLKKDIIESGAKVQTELMAQEYYKRAETAAQALNNKFQKEELLNLLAKLKNRKA